MRFLRRRFPAILSGLVFLFSPLAMLAQSQDATRNPREQQAIDQAQQYEQAHQYVFAIDSYKKANKIAGGKCIACLTHLSSLYRHAGDNKHSAAVAAQLGQLVTLPADKAAAAMLQGAALLREATQKNKRELFQQADAQFKQALQYQPGTAQALFLDGLALGRLGNDAAAKESFARYAASIHADPIMQARARRYVADPALTREKMAPAFAVRTMQGNVLSLDNQQGRVVLLDFWATWCGPCKEELPHIQKIVQRFQGQPLVVLSVSLDTDQAKWQAFVEQHGMTWPQFWDKGGVMAISFGVRAIPHYFTIDTQGVLRSENMGAGIDGRLKKMVAQARQMEEQPTIKAAAGQ
ncbi:MAG: TlpA family protein disulfide reductase [Acidobacteriaceae bacterium]